MKQALQDYCRGIEEKAEKFAQEEEMNRRDDHLRAFNLGRMAQRVERSRHEAWLRVVWLLLGLTIGLACGIPYPNHLYPLFARKFLTKVDVVFRDAGTPGHGVWRGLHPRG